MSDDNEPTESFDPGSIFDDPAFGEGSSDPEDSEDTAFMGADAEKPADEQEVETEAQDAEKPEENQPPATPPAKKLQFKLGDAVTDLDETAMVEWKVDGKPTPVAVKDLLQNYAGKIAWDRRMNEVALERKAVRTDRQTFDGDRERHKGLITNLHKKVGEGKILEAVGDLIQMTGLQVDPRQYTQQFRAKLYEHAKQLAEMSDEDRARHEIEEEREYLRTQRESLEQQRKAEQAQKAHEQRVANAIKTSGVSEDQFAETYDWLKARVREQGGDPASVTPEYVVSHRANMRAYEVARDAIASVEPDAIGENNLVKDEARWDKLAALAKAHPDFTAEEFAEMYRETRKAKLATSVSKKVTKAPTRTAATAAIRAKPKTERVDLLNTEYTEDDIRGW